MRSNIFKLRALKGKERFFICLCKDNDSKKWSSQLHFELAF